MVFLYVTYGVEQKPSKTFLLDVDTAKQNGRCTSIEAKSRTHLLRLEAPGETALFTGGSLTTSGVLPALDPANIGNSSYRSLDM